MRHWWNAYRDAHGLKQFERAIQALQDANAGVEDAWAEPNTPAEEIAQWVDEFMAESPRVVQRYVPEAEIFKVVLARCDEALWEALPHGALIADEAILYVWEGTRLAWLQTGRDALLTAIPTNHTGLYTGANSMGRLVAQWRHHASNRNGA